VLLISAGAVLCGAAGAPLKSFTPGAIWPDNKGVHVTAHGGGILPHEGVYYWFGEHKVAGGRGNSAQVGVSVYSSRDLYNWKNEGIALRVSNAPGSDIAKGCRIERPKVIFNARTGKFVMWFHLELKGQKYEAARAALAVADKVTGPYRFVKSLRPNAGVWPINMDEFKKLARASKTKQWQRGIIDGKHLRRDFAGGQAARDMTLFVDDDGKAYLIFASEENCTLHIAELTDDYQGFTGKWARALPGDLNEAPAVFKRDGKYYMFSSGCTGWAPNPARSAVADSIFGPWKALGNPCRGNKQQNATTFESQSTFVLPAPGKPGEFIYMGDRWRPKNPIDGRYVWLPIEWERDKPVLRWRDEWDLSVFGK
jgi:beta-xylosidase